MFYGIRETAPDFDPAKEVMQTKATLTDTISLVDSVTLAMLKTQYTKYGNEIKKLKGKVKRLTYRKDSLEMEHIRKDGLLSDTVNYGRWDDKQHLITKEDIPVIYF